MSKTALITGVTGQDGSYLAELVLEKGYEVRGIKRRAGQFNADRIDHLYKDPHKEDVRFHQASTSELYGQVQGSPQHEETSFHFRSPYGVAKLYGYWISVNYRERYGLFACNGILFNHESPVRGETFETRKITRAAARIRLGLHDKMYLGNLYARRDWGHAKDYVEGIWLMLQLEEPGDFVLATGETNSVRSLCVKAFGAVDIQLNWEDEGAQEKGDDAESGRCLIEVDPRYFRPAEVEVSEYDASWARHRLGWEPRHTLDEMMREMVEADLEAAMKQQVLEDWTFR